MTSGFLRDIIRSGEVERGARDMDARQQTYETLLGMPEARLAELARRRGAVQAFARTVERRRAADRIRAEYRKRRYAARRGTAETDAG